jgi:short-subunit dehydrogenase
MTKTVLITGASGGLGKELANVFYLDDKKWNLILHYNEHEPHIPISNRVTWWKHDSLNPSEIPKFIDDKNIDLLINCAGIYSGHLYDVMEVNFYFPVFLIEKLKNIKKIININSLAGLQAGKGEKEYAASKQAFKGYCQALKLDGFEITDAFLGAMKTKMTKHRSDWNELMNPSEVADIIYNLAEKKQTAYIPEITIRRKS